MDIMLNSTSASTASSFGSYRANRKSDEDLDNTESGNDSSKVMRTLNKRPINIVHSLLIPGGSGAVSAAYCNEETFSTSFLVLDGFLTIYLGEYYPSSENEGDKNNVRNTIRYAAERWGKRVDTNVCIGKVSYEYRMTEKHEKSMDVQSSTKNASIISQKLVKKPLGVPEPLDSKHISPDNYLPPTHKMVADCLTFKEYDEAINVYEDILQTDEERYGGKDLVCAIDLHNLGVTNLLAGNLNEAMKYFEESIVCKRGCLGENDNSISDSLVEIGIILYYKGDMEGALSKFWEAHGIVTKNSSSDHIGRICNNIACVYYIMGNLDSASSYFQNALVNQRADMGSNTKAESALLNFALTQANSGHLKLRQNHLDEAIAPLEESLLVLESVLDDYSDTVDSVRANIAIAKKTHEI